ncbi:MAG TPA: hypothetical protein VKY85_26780 [Candidatus Angelobacter sp.]|nr:hypothetical protein [Candidatus Angelobacter sp.]
MDSSSWWPRLPSARKPKPPPPEDSLSQEDEETRRTIARYLHLADRLLSAETPEGQEPEGQEEDESSAA